MLNEIRPLPLETLSLPMISCMVLGPDSDHTLLTHQPPLLHGLASSFVTFLDAATIS